MILRRSHRPTRDFTILANSILRDDRLSYRARGILCQVLSMPDDWRVDAEQLSRGEHVEGRDAVRTAIKELEKVGYIERVKGQDDNGRWVTILVVHEVPQGPEGPEEDVSAGRTDDWKTDVGKPGAIRRTVTNSSHASSTPRGKAPSRRRRPSNPAEPAPSPQRDPVREAAEGALALELWHGDSKSPYWIDELSRVLVPGRDPSGVLERWRAAGREGICRTTSPAAVA